MGPDDYHAQPTKSRRGENAGANAVLLKKKIGVEFLLRRSRPRILWVQALVSQSFQCHKLVNIFEMVPPVQRIHQLANLFTTTAFCRQAIVESLGRGAIPNCELTGLSYTRIVESLGRGAIPNHRR